MQDGEGAEPGSEEEDTGMYTEEYTEQYEYADDAAGQEGEVEDLQGSELLTSEVPADVAEIDLRDEDVQDDGDLGAEADMASGAEGDDDDAEEAAAPVDYPVSDHYYSYHTS